MKAHPMVIARRVGAAVALCLLGVASVRADPPAAVTAGAAAQSVPVYTPLQPAPTVSNVTVETPQTFGVLTFDEVVGNTSLNPYGANDATIAFVIAAPSGTQFTDIALSGFAGYQASVLACNPLLPASGCGSSAQAGTVSLSADGNTLNFMNPQLVGATNLFALPPGIQATDLYGIFTNASGVADPPNIQVSYSPSPGAGVLTADFSGVVPSGSTGTASVPEPAVAGLLGVGLAAIAFARRGRRLPKAA